MLAEETGRGDWSRRCVEEVGRGGWSRRLVEEDGRGGRLRWLVEEGGRGGWSRRPVVKIVEDHTSELQTTRDSAEAVIST